MPSSDAVYTNCEDYEPHEGHPMGGNEFCIGVSAPDGSIESLSETLDKLKKQSDRLNSPKFDIDLFYRKLGLSSEEAKVARRGSSIQAHYEGELGTDS